MIVHRARRDINRCRQKYGEDWDHYCKKVPWLFIPFVFLNKLSNKYKHGKQNRPAPLLAVDLLRKK